MKINYTDTTEMNNLLIEVESNIRRLENLCDSLRVERTEAMIARKEGRSGNQPTALELTRRLRRVQQAVEGNRIERDELMNQIELAANNNINAAHRHSQLPVNFWPTNLVD